MRAERRMRMSYLTVAPEMMTSAATDLATIGSDLSAAHTTAASTVALVPAAADEVSASIADLFSQYGAEFQALGGRASAFHDQFVSNLKARACAYATTETASALPFRTNPQDLVWALVHSPQVFRTTPQDLVWALVLSPLALVQAVQALEDVQAFRQAVQALEKALQGL
jgi:hypothetical protein